MTFVYWLDRKKLSERSYRNLKLKFTSKEYKYFQKLDWNTLRGKQNYDFKNYDDFQKLKEQDIRVSFVFQSEADFSTLHNAIKNTLSLEENNGWGIELALNTVVEENFLRNEELGFKLLESILKNYPNGLSPLYKPIRIISQKSSDWSLRLWTIIKNWNHDCKLYWQLSFFDCLPIGYVNYFYKNELLRTIKSIDRNCNLQFESFEKFISVKSEKQEDTNTEKNILEEILSMAYQKNENENLRISISIHFFEKYSAMLADNFELLKKSYIQQEKKINNYFDFQRVGLKSLLYIKPDFLLEYIAAFYANKVNHHSRDTQNQLPFVWDLEKWNELVEKATIIIIENNHYYGILEHPIIIFFYHLNEEQKTKAKAFLLNFISKYNSEEKKMNPVFDVLRHTMKEFFEEAFLHYISLNTDISNFKKIWWRGNGGTYNGNIIIGEVHAKEWQNIMTMINKSESQLDLIPIKNYIKKQIENELRSAEEERKNKFLDPDNW